MKNKSLGLIIVLLVLFSAGVSCWYFYQSKASIPEITGKSQVNNQPLLGSDRDEHGCIGSAGYSWCQVKQKCLRPWEEPCESDTAVEYKNIEFGFNFILPLSWKGYSIVTTNWTGNPVNEKVGQIINGPQILIRHPLWTVENPRQDIPVMIFTFDEWNLIQQEKIALGAAPIGPSELGRNANYIFALPARYNYAFPTGFEEVEKIMEGKPLQAF